MKEEEFMLNKNEIIINIHKKFEKCKCLTKKEKDTLIEFIRKCEREEGK